MIKSKKRFSVSLMAALTLMAAGVAGFAQRHFMLSNVARPEVKMQLSAAVERESGAVPLSKDTVVNLGDVLDWTITAENDGNGAAVEYKAVARQPMIEEKQADGSSKRVPAPVSSYTDVRYEWADPLAPGGKLSASYKVRVK